MFSRDYILSHIDYATLLGTCQGGQTCLDLVEAASIATDTDSDKETEIVESCQETQVLDRSVSFGTYASSLPVRIWDPQHTWSPPAGTISYNGASEFSELVRKQAHSSTTSWATSKTMFSGACVGDLADKILDCLDCAVSASDFLCFMGNHREFDIADPRNGWLVSTGHGIEVEAMHRAFEKFTQNQSAYFADAMDRFCTLRTLNPAMAASAVSTQRKTNMKKLGALIGLMVVLCLKPGPITPLIIQLFVYDCNFHSLTPELVEDWHPGLSLLIKQWIHAGPDGDIQPFSSHLLSYHDIQPSALENRDASTHGAYAAIFLARAVLGLEDHRHPEIAAFREGFNLPCPNGFTLPHALMAMKGGVPRILRMIWTNVIEDYESLKPSLTFAVNNDISQDDLTMFHRLYGHDTSLQSLITQFLSGSGIPDAEKWADLTGDGQLQGLPPIEDMNKSSFRPRMLTQAMTGSPHLPTGPMQITFVSQRDGRHIGSEINRNYAFQPLIEFRTCFKTASVPFFYFLQIGSAEDRVKAVETWLLFEILNAVRGYSIM